MTLAFLGLPSDLPDELVLELFSLTKFLVKSEIRDSIPDSLRHYGFFFFFFLNNGMHVQGVTNVCQIIQGQHIPELHDCFDSS